MNAEYELLQIISRNRNAILEDCRKHKTSTFCSLGTFEYLLDDKTLEYSGTLSQKAYETATYVGDGVRGTLIKILDNLSHAQFERPEHVQVWSSEPLPALGHSKLRTAYFTEVAETALKQAFGSSRQRILVESHGMIHEYVIGEADIAVTVFARWKELHHHYRTVRFPFPEPNATNLFEEFAMAKAFAAEVVKGTHELVADQSYWPSLEDVQMYERRQAIHIVMEALDTLSDWQRTTVLKHPDFMEKALKLWIDEQAEKKAARQQKAADTSAVEA